MTPLTREEREAVILSHPAAEPGDVESDLDEYELLVAARFASDPSEEPPVGAQPEALTLARRGEPRLMELHRKLFGNPAAEL